MGKELNLYPVMVSDSTGVTLIGGTIDGQVPLDLDWGDAYVNSAAVFVRGTQGVVIRDWTITQAWDAIRIRGSNDFTIENVWITQTRDDAIENDDGLSGTVRDSLFDGVFVGMSTSDAKTPNRSANVVTFDNVLIRMEEYLFKGEETHQSPFKVTGVSPGMKIYDSVIAIENVNHVGQERLKLAWEKTIDASGNYFLNLSDEPLPKGYPLPPKGFTVLQGEAARAFWEDARSDWIAEHTGIEPAPEGTHVGGDAADTLKGSLDDDVMLGGGGDDFLLALSGDDVVRGQNGDDILIGRVGADVLVGGLGKDLFRFSNSADESGVDAPDIVRGGDGASAFEGAGAAAGDQFDLRGIDADATLKGNQAFLFGATKRGGLSLVDLDGNTVVRGNIDGDSAFEFVVVIEDGAVAARKYAASDFML